MDYKLLNPSTTCRICLGIKDPLNDMLSTEHRHLLETYEAFTRFQALNKFCMICEACSVKLLSSYAFLETCQQSEMKLRDNVNQMEVLATESIKVEIDDTIIQGEDFDEESSFEMCGECNFVTNDFKQLSDHMRFKHNDLFLNWCEKCRSTFDDLENHRKKMHEDIETEQETKTKQYQDSQIKGNIICKDCGERFVYKSQLNRHKRRHTGEKPFSCSVCDKRFSRRDNLRIHMRLHIEQNYEDKKIDQIKPNRNTKNHSCSHCGKLFDGMAHLIRHQMVHTGEKPFKCQFCIKSFRVNYQLKMHEKTHKCKKVGEKSTNDEKNENDDNELFKCDICDSKEFISKGQLDRHMFTHIDDKHNLICDHCGKGFPEKSFLLKHTKEHDPKTKIKSK